MNPERARSPYLLAAAFEAQKAQIQGIATEVADIRGDITDIKNSISQILGLFLQNIAETTSEPEPEPIIPDPPILDPPSVPEPGSQSSSFLYKGLIQEASKKVYKFPEAYKLVGPENYDQWKQALSIQLAAMEFDIFITDPSVVDKLGKSSQAVLLMIIRDSVTTIPAASIAWLDSPRKAYHTLERQFSYSTRLQRESLYKEFHTLSFSGFKGTLFEFNAQFSSLLARLLAAKATIDAEDQVNQYLTALERSFPN